MRMEDIIAAKKAAFLDRYNPNRLEKVAATQAIGAAARRRNSPYQRGIGQNGRQPFRKFWCDTLREWAQEYQECTKNGANWEHHTKICELLHKLNGCRELRCLINAEGIRISHAQKSLNVYLKHLWCMGCIGEPPESPVDSVVLHAARWPRNGLRWTRVKTIKEHKIHIDFLREVACKANQSLAVWELLYREGYRLTVVAWGLG